MEGFFKVNQSGGSYVTAEFYNPTTGETRSECVRDYDYGDCSRDNDELYNMPIDKEVRTLWLAHALLEVAYAQQGGLVDVRVSGIRTGFDDLGFAGILADRAPRHQLVSGPLFALDCLLCGKGHEVLDPVVQCLGNGQHVGDLIVGQQV